jgi:hypothetical protein
MSLIHFESALRISRAAKPGLADSGGSLRTKEDHNPDTNKTQFEITIQQLQSASKRLQLSFFGILPAFSSAL